MEISLRRSYRVVDSNKSNGGLLREGKKAFRMKSSEHGRRLEITLRPPIDTPRWSNNNNLYTLCSG